MWFFQILYKEFLSLRPVIWLALLAFTIAILGLQGNRVVMSYIGKIGPAYPFLSSNFMNAYFVVAYFLAVIVGIWQTQSEFFRGTWLFLLHRPRGLTELVVAKAFSGTLISLTVCAIPAILYGMSVSIPGVLPGPFQWSYTGQFWRLWLFIPILQLGAYTTGLRHGRWYVSRLCPFLAAVLMTALTFLLAIHWLLLIVLLGFVLVLQVIELRQEVSQRDFS